MKYILACLDAQDNMVDERIYNEMFDKNYADWFHGCPNATKVKLYKLIFDDNIGRYRSQLMWALEAPVSKRRVINAPKAETTG